MTDQPRDPIITTLARILTGVVVACLIAIAVAGTYRAVAALTGAALPACEPAEEATHD